MAVRSRRNKIPFALFACLLLMIYVYFVMILKEKSQNDPDDYIIAQQTRIDRAAREIEKLEKESAIIEGLLPLAHPQAGYLAGEHEQLRRKIENGILELYFSATSQLIDIKNLVDRKVATKLEAKLTFLSNQLRTVMADELRLADVDGSGFRREIQLKNLSNLMQKRLISLQNPRHCASARKLQCYINKSCGFGCQLHHVAYCLIFAYATERTLILEGNGQTWDYSRKGWTAAFLPVSDTCLDNGTEEAKFWNSLEESKNHPVISLPVIDELRNGPSFLPQSIPKDLAADLLRLHGYPPAWFVGHFVDYLMRSSPQMKKMLSIAENKVNFAKGPIVGLQVRRTDKIGSEAAFHDVEEYMVWADHWFAVQSLKQGKQLRKRVFVATDEPAVITEIKERYKEYDVIANSNSAILANLQDRYTESSLFGVVADIRLLSNCNYLVCTFSSQICRLAYELMQVRRGDAAASFHSLDDIYYFGGQQAREQEAILSHSPINEDEIELQVGDIIVIAGNHWNGMSKGRNKRTNREGLYPSYKVKENWRIEKFPSYPNVKI